MILNKKVMQINKQEAGVQLLESDN